MADKSDFSAAVIDITRQPETESAFQSGQAERRARCPSELMEAQEQRKAREKVAALLGLDERQPDKRLLTLVSRVVLEHEPVVETAQELGIPPKDAEQLVAAIEQATDPSRRKVLPFRRPSRGRKAGL